MKELQEVRNEVLHLKNMGVINKQEETKLLHKLNALEEAISVTRCSTELNFLNINKMDKTTKKELDELVQTVSKTLIATMNVLDLKTHIEMTSVCDGYRYKLRFDKEKI